MKKTLFLLLLLSLFSTFLVAQQADSQPTPTPEPRIQGAIVDTEVIEINVNDMAPASGIYKSKSDTFFVTGKYRFVLDDKIVQENSELLLNKWLKESK
ncbi:MAG: hypothetical protein PHY41_01790 [Candidatus Cloacimonetes bacterium]|jgi:hypothetical protein|nr:hypothetical protein [Candidatus Cloacimonadota bacterium]MDY0299330.1 hypothetical protein [Candidatus Cloacimonadaceae bacterium]MCB5279776.1 hypothetical protein [Candidatus Cloacimonadota bacterium]MCK9332904.1 hypothetical protein [Candidatus Cloacimonadota bacterium]MDD2211213.1 hypothetical protein [Candidatus Cloacimonadota bacterium]